MYVCTLEVIALTSACTGSAALVARLRKIEGQARGIARMIEESRDCDDIVVQLAALKAAVNKACMAFIASHLEECLGPEIGDEQSRQALKKATRMFLQVSK
jgi:DNA-binding FrmR family transcriptional regulator